MEAIVDEMCNVDTDLSEETKGFALHLSSAADGSRLVCVDGHTSKLHVLDALSNLETTCTLTPDDLAAVTDTCFDPFSSDIVFAATNRGVVDVFDGRTGAEVVRRFEASSKFQHDGSNTLNTSLTSLDINVDGSLMCVGTEVAATDVFILFFDVRCDKKGNDKALLGGYWNSHHDDVTRVRFHPRCRHMLASCDVDGVVNIFDLRNNNEDDALLLSMNNESSMKNLTWFKDNDLACESNDEHLKLYLKALDEETCLQRSFTRKQLCDAMYRTKVQSTYIAGCHADCDDDLLIVTGSWDDGGGCLRVLKRSGDDDSDAIGREDDFEYDDDERKNSESRLQPYARLAEGRKLGLVRSSKWNSRSRRLFTADEDGFVRCYVLSDGSSKEENCPKRSKKSKKARVKPY